MELQCCRRVVLHGNFWLQLFCSMFDWDDETFDLLSDQGGVPDPGAPTQRSETEAAFVAPLALIYRLRHGHVLSNMSGFVELLELRRDFDDALNELKIEMELEVTIRHRYIQATDTSIRIEGGILGTRFLSDPHSAREAQDEFR